MVFTQGATGPSCVLVRFSAMTYASFAIDTVVIRARLDNTTTALPAAVNFTNETASQGHGHMFEFIFPSAPRQPHAAHAIQQHQGQYRIHQRAQHGRAIRQIAEPRPAARAHASRGENRRAACYRMRGGASRRRDNDRSPRRWPMPP